MTKKLWRAVGSAIESELLERLLLKTSFSRAGAEQVRVDMGALCSALPRTAGAVMCLTGGGSASGLAVTASAAPASAGGANQMLRVSPLANALANELPQLRRVREAVGLLLLPSARLLELDAALRRAEAEVNDDDESDGGAEAGARADGAAAADKMRPAAAAAGARMLECGVRALSAGQVRRLLRQSLATLRQ
ncbi:hypothetical protein T492DRAFT_43355 [Pavlovales sp. CCMP2436]|nr:hypothetical protein T492DRAFT_43355 [Pavlovales sp. CCMP2436]